LAAQVTKVWSLVLPLLCHCAGRSEFKPHYESAELGIAFPVLIQFRKETGFADAKLVSP
jgi:hypothetical protein